MTKRIVLAAALVLLALPAGAAAPSGFDQSPLLHVRWETFTIAGERLETTIQIHLAGATELVETREDGPARIVRGMAPAGSLAALNAALKAGQIGLERGGCGEPNPDGAVEYDITWYGKGERFNSFRVGASLQGCSSALQRIIDSIFFLTDAVVSDEQSQTFPRRRN
jgi:hypothetical protein